MKFLPAHHPMCVCELCLIQAAYANGRQTPSDLQRAEEILEECGFTAKARTDKSNPSERSTDSPASMGEALRGRRVKFEWAHGSTRQDHPDDGTYDWMAVNEARCLSVSNTAMLLERPFANPRWWSIKAFLWIEVVPEDAPKAPVQP